MAARRFRVSYGDTDGVVVTRKGNGTSLEITQCTTNINENPQQYTAGFDCVAIAGVIQKSDGESSNSLLAITKAKAVGRIGTTDILRIEDLRLVNIAKPKEESSPKQLKDLLKLLSEGEYYFRK